MEAQDLKVRTDEERNTIRAQHSFGNTEMTVIVHFDDDDRSVGLVTYDYCVFPEDKLQKMYEICSKMNHQYRWVKFAVDEETNSIDIFDDAVIQLDTVGEEVAELIGRMMSIGEKAYPNFMKAIWA